VHGTSPFKVSAARRGPNPCLSPRGEGRRRPRRRVRVRQRPAELAARSFLACQTPLPALSPSAADGERVSETDRRQHLERGGAWHLSSDTYPARCPKTVPRPESWCHHQCKTIPPARRDLACRASRARPIPPMEPGLHGGLRVGRSLLVPENQPQPTHARRGGRHQRDGTGART
jgi:hypothetical protein